MNTDTPTLAVAAALVVVTLAIVCTALWRSLTRWFATFSWQPRLSPGIRAEILMVMSADGHVAIQCEKLTPEDNVSEIFSRFLEQLFAVGEQMGVTVHWSSKIGAVIDTPEGPEYVVALIRPAPPKVREMTDLETDSIGAGDRADKE